MAELELVEIELRQRLGEQPALESESRELRARLAEREKSLSEQRAIGTKLREQLDEREASLRASDSALAEARTRALRLETDLDHARQGTAATAKDDLKVLRGVGPSFERALNGMGVTCFAQIAAWTESDLDEVAQQLRTTPQRILRDDWIGGAQEELRRQRTEKH